MVYTNQTSLRRASFPNRNVSATPAKPPKPVPSPLEDPEDSPEHPPRPAPQQKPKPLTDLILVKLGVCTPPVL